MPARGPPGRGPPGMPARGPPGRGPPGMPARGPPGMPARGPPGRGLPGMPARGPPGRGPPGMPARGPPGMPGRGPPGMPGRGPPGASAQGPRFGKLSIKVMKAFELKGVAMMQTADPYCKLTIGTQEFQTKVHEKGGKNPIWDETFNFNIATEKSLIVEIYDKENSGKDRFMGQAQVPIAPWLSKGVFEGDIDIKDNSDKPAGKLSLSVKFSKPQPGAAGGIKAPPKAPPLLQQSAPGGPPGAAPGVVSEPPRDPNGKFTDKEILEVR